MVARQQIKIYVEGGSKGALFRECKEGFGKFLENAGLAGRMPKVIPCGSRQEAYKDFCTALKVDPTEILHLLLVDSEAPVTESPWLHVLHREGDGWKKPQDATDQDLYFMVQVMESWFLADRGALKNYFGADFKENKLPKGNQLEAIPKLQVFQGLKDATRECGRHKGYQSETYHKGRDSFEILGKIQPRLVANASPEAARLLTRLGAAVGPDSR